MARPKGSLNKSTVEEVNSVPETVESVKEANKDVQKSLKHKAFSVVREERNGKLRYVVVEVKFDLESGSVGEVTRVEESEDSDSAILRFKVLSGDEFM